MRLSSGSGSGGAAPVRQPYAVANAARTAATRSSASAGAWVSAVVVTSALASTTSSGSTTLTFEPKNPPERARRVQLRLWVAAWNVGVSVAGSANWNGTLVPALY